MNKYIKPGMTVFDIGASTGVHTLRMAKLAKKVYAFEPSDWMHERLLQNISLNNFKNVVTNKVALSDVNGRALYCSEEHDRVDKKPNERKYIKMDYVRLDDYVKENNIKALDFIKIDVDGFECRILEGGAKTIKKYKPIMIIEIGKGLQEQFGRTLSLLITMLKSFGYKFYDEKTEKEYESLVDALPDNASINVLCMV